MNTPLPSEPVEVSRHDDIVTVRLNRPPLNPIDTALRDRLAETVTQLSDDPTVRASIITGGEKNFAAGADIEALAAMDYSQIADWNARLQHTFSSVAALPFPVIAAIEGYALGGGLELALAADLRIGSTRCTVGLPEVTLGIIPGSGGTQRLTQIVGRSQAKRLIFTGRQLQADEAVALGIVDWTVEAGQTYESAHELAASLARAPRHALRAAKESIDAAWPVSPTGLALERSWLAGLFSTPERSEAMAEFLRRRQERTTGPGGRHATD